MPFFTSERFTGAKLLREILEPSREINQHYQTYMLTDTSGKQITGLLVREDDEAFHLLGNPLEPDQITVVAKADVEEVTVSKQSTMPEGLLMTLTREEILDLLAYIEAGGNPGHPCFQPRP